MTNIKHRIDSVVDAAQDEIVSFLQTLVQSPSLANNEGAVQELVSEKLKSLHLDVEKFPVHFACYTCYSVINQGYSPR